MNVFKSILITILLLITLTGISSCNSNTPIEIPHSAKGILDLRNWDFVKDGNIKLNGQWEFYWQRLYKPSDFQKELVEKPEYIKVPKLWSNQQQDSKKYPLYGYATYRLKVLLNDDKQLINLYSKTAIYSSSQIFINGVDVGGNGKVSYKKETGSASYNLLIKPFQVKSDELEIIIHVSNFEKNRSGGFIFELQLGEVNHIAKLEKKNLIINLLIIGGILIVIIYHFALFMMRPFKRSNLYLALFNLFIVSYFSSLYGLQYFIPNFQFIRDIRILGWFMAVPTFMLLIKSIFPKEINNHLPKLAVIIGIGSYLAFLFDIEYTLDFYKGVTIVSELYIIVIAILAAIRNKENAYIFLFSITFVAISGINDSLLHFGLIKSVNLAQFGIFMFLLIQSFILSSRFSTAYKKNVKMSNELAYVNKNLENLVLERTKKIEDQNVQLEKLNATKDRFFSIISHDLRGPVCNLASSLGLITESFNELDEKTKFELLSSLKSSSDKTYHLLENLLIWSRIQGDSIRFEPGNLLLNQMVTENIELLQANADQKQIKISVQIPEDLEIYADNYMIDTVIRNLLGNAIKFTGNNGKIDISAESNENKVEIVISDTGIGIKEKDREKLFRIEHNFQLIGTNGEKGSGLGLILCKEFIDKHNGEILVESILGKGSTFKLFLPG
ncbi:MAG: hypothetical protein DRI95_00950 [Bacteroidetes bacterium]|nr:MAG: hypothetical protein DRI95_00950 [Bacteroidota bacterium]